MIMNIKASKGKVQNKKIEKKLTNVSFAFTHTYTPVKTNIFRFFPQSYMENFEKCAKTQKQKTICCPMLPVVVSFFPLFFWEPFPNVIFDFPEVSALCISPKYGRYTGDFPQMPVNTGAPLFIRATWPHWEGCVGANSPL